MKPQLAAIAREHGDKVVILLVDAARYGEMAQKAGVRGIPDSRLMLGGRQLEKVVGAYPKEHFVRLIEKHAAALPEPIPMVPSQSGEEGKPAENAITPMKDDWLPPGVSPVDEG